MFIEVDTLRPPIAEQNDGTFGNVLSYICRDRIISCSFVLNSLRLKEKKSHFTSRDKMFNLYISAFELHNIRFKQNTKSTPIVFFRKR